MGNFSEQYSESDSDPLNYVFTRERGNKGSNRELKRELALYRGLYEEGRNMGNYCKKNRPITYGTEWQKIQVMRSILSDVQYIGLDLTSRALPAYAKALEFSKVEYEHLVQGLVGNYCSTNLSVISKKELLNNLLIKYDRESTYRLPNVSGNPFFPDHLETFLSPKAALEQEFKYTVKLFQSLCSWGGNPTNAGLMLPLIKHPAIMAFIFRQMNNQAIEWKEADNSLYLKEDKKTTQVWCDNLICRKSSPENFYSSIHYSVGGTNLSEDFKRLYCEDFLMQDFKPAENDERLNAIMRARSIEEENFINSQLIALITGVPDFLMRLEKFSAGEDLLRSSVDYTWNKWAHTQTDQLHRDLYFEEPLMIELLTRSMYFDPRVLRFKVAFDVNLGEFDRASERVGKVRLSFKLPLHRSFIHYYREALKNIDPRDLNEKERLLKRFKIQLTGSLNQAREKLIIPPWKGDLEGLIARELSEQIMSFSDKDFTLMETGVEEVPIEINYGLFALKYINHQKTVQNRRSNSSLKSTSEMTSKSN
ncbi:MAG: hypothetical protein KBD76_00805 [Bacteriovorax sp.]|nr:hypothetical protein [Bacteriovorax sp.]